MRRFILSITLTLGVLLLTTATALADSIGPGI